MKNREIEVISCFCLWGLFHLEQNLAEQLGKVFTPIILITNVCDILLIISVYITHPSHLLVAFQQVQLIDAECIVPAERTQQVVHPRQILRPAKTLPPLN